MIIEEIIKDKLDKEQNKILMKSYKDFEDYSLFEHLGGIDRTNPSNNLNDILVLFDEIGVLTNYFKNLNGWDPNLLVEKIDILKFEVSPKDKTIELNYNYTFKNIEKNERETYNDNYKMYFLELTDEVFDVLLEPTDPWNILSKNFFHLGSRDLEVNFLYSKKDCQNVENTLATKKIKQKEKDLF